MDRLPIIITGIGTIITSLSPIILAFINKGNKKSMEDVKAIVVSEMKNTKDSIQERIDNNEKDHLRYEILSFAGDLRNGVKKTRQEFETIFSFHDKYEEIIISLKQHNGYLDSEFEYIKECYKKLGEETLL